MGQGKTILVLLTMVAGFGIAIHFFTSVIGPPPTDNPVITTVDISRPRAPSKARKIKNPIPSSSEIIQEGKALYDGKGGCFACHGNTGKGDGESGTMLRPRPRNLTNTSFQMLRADGEIFWSIKFGVSKTSMFSAVPRLMSEEEAWKIVHYIRSLKQEN